VHDDALDRLSTQMLDGGAIVSGRVSARYAEFTQ
jgi:hypothetical protein